MPLSLPFHLASLVTDDSVTTNHTIKLHVILSQLTDIKGEGAKSKKMREKWKWVKDERRKQNNNMAESISILRRKCKSPH